MELRFYKVSELIGVFDPAKILEFVGKSTFLLIYDLENRTNLIGLAGETSEETRMAIENGIPGIRLSITEFNRRDNQADLVAFSVYRHIVKPDINLFNDIFDIAPKEGFLAIAFIYADREETESAKIYLERSLSSKKIRETESLVRNYLGGRANSTEHREIYDESDETIIFRRLLESINNSILSNGLIYKVFLIAPKGSDFISKYVNTHFLVLDEYEFRKTKIASAAEILSRRNSIPFGADYAGEFIRFYGFYKLNRVLPTAMPAFDDGIEIGKLVKDGVLETDINIKVNPSTLNLGFIITGLPGSGKTREAMSILSNIIRLNEKRQSKTAVLVVTPTDEWKGFAHEHGMFLISAYEDNIPINFFRCPPNVGLEKFYGNLAMILSTAANAGPYQNPMEKTMLNAFRHVYKGDKTPDPVLLYNEIEKSIVKYHGKQTSSGAKYTKHGENIKSSLENLRDMLSMPQYCVKHGVKIEDLLKNGVVFDVSNASTNLKTHLYALILNQIYAIASNFDARGDDELRLIICLEEAQTIFGSADSAAVRDIKQRIQDFRKQGIALVLLTHNVNDIEIGIRRLCQLKLYFKQASDTAHIAARDLIFGSADEDDAVLKLKLLDSNIGAFSCVLKKGREKLQQETIFIKTSPCDMPYGSLTNDMIGNYTNKLGLSTAKRIKCRIQLAIGENSIDLESVTEFYQIRISYLGDELFRLSLSETENSEIVLLDGKEYIVQLLNKNNRILKEYNVNASENIFLDIRK